MNQTYATPVSRLLAIATIAGLAAALVTSGAQAADKNELFKCVDAAGVVSIQSEPCAKGSTQVWRRDATPEPTPSPEQAAQAEARIRRDQQAVRELSEIVERKLKPVPEAELDQRRSEPPATRPEPTACEAAQDFAASLQGKPWLELSEAQTRRLYGWVSEQCKPARGA
jgi:hypothetical protein